jgi:DNA-binding transcriptional regulator YiaG
MKSRKVRKAFGERQEDFCQRLGVAISTLRSWEQGQGEPIGPARILLSRLKEDLEEGRVEEVSR